MKETRRKALARVRERAERTAQSYRDHADKVDLSLIIESFALSVAGDVGAGLPTESFAFNQAKALQSAAHASRLLGAPADRRAVWNALYLAEVAHYAYGRPIFADCWVATPIGVMPRNLSAITDGLPLDAEMDRDLFSRSDLDAIEAACAKDPEDARRDVLASAPMTGAAPGERLDVMAAELPPEPHDDDGRRAEIMHFSRHVMI